MRYFTFYNQYFPSLIPTLFYAKHCMLKASNALYASYIVCINHFMHDECQPIYWVYLLYSCQPMRFFKSFIHNCSIQNIVCPKHHMHCMHHALYELAIVCIIHDHMLYIVTTWAYCCVQFTLETRRGPKDQPTDLPADQPTDRHWYL